MSRRWGNAQALLRGMEASRTGAGARVPREALSQVCVPSSSTKEQDAQHKPRQGPSRAVSSWS